MISVCIASYNGAKYIKKQIDSILRQLHNEDELVISDDSSIDETVNIVRLYDDKRIKLLTGYSFHSPIFNFENAIKHSSGDIIVLSDQDDVWYENKIETLTRIFYSNPQSLLALHNYDIIDGEGKIVMTKVYGENDITNDSFFKAVHKNKYIGCCMAFRRELLKYILPFPEKIAMHDIWIGLMAKYMNKVVYCEEPLIFYRRHQNNFSSYTPFPLWYRIYYRLYILIRIIYRVHFQIGKLK